MASNLIFNLPDLQQRGALPGGGVGPGSAWLVGDNTNGADGLIGNTDAFAFLFQTNSLTRGRFAATGELAVGPNAPTAGNILEVQGTGTQAISLTQGTGIGVWFWPAGGQLHVGGTTAVYTNTADSVQIRTIANGPISLQSFGSGAFSALSGATGPATFDSGGTGAGHFGDSANDHTNTFGSLTGVSATTLQAGTGALTLKHNGVTWTWPSADGAAGGVLTTNGSGGLSFTGGVNVFTQNTSAQSIANTGTPATLTGWTDVTANAAWVPATGVFTAPVAGFYLFSVTITWAATAQALGALFVLSLLKSNAPTTPIASSWSQPVAALSQVHSQTITVGVSLALGETVSVQAALSGGTGANALTATANANTLSITQLH